MKIYTSLKIQILGIAIIIIGIFLAMYQIDTGIIFGSYQPFTQEGFLVVLIGLIFVIWGTLRKD